MVNWKNKPMNQSPTITYAPGVCNIGPEEISRRRTIGWIGLLAAIVLFAALFLTGVNPWWRLFVFLPATMSASGFLQATMKFCVGFAQKGVYNLGPIGSVQPVADKEAAAKDRKHGMSITGYSVLIGVVVTVIAILI